MRKPSYHLTTFGCQMNERDSETMAGMLETMGYRRSESRDTADVVLLNTCSVRENADNRFFGTLGQLKKQKEANPRLTVCVCGCMMQQQHIIDQIKTKYPWVDLIFGTHNIHRFPQLLRNTRSNKTNVIDVWEEGEQIIEGLPAKRKYKHKAFVNIMYGCNNFCTYCIVPYTRGRERSRKESHILREVRQLIAQGVKEITLLGQNVNSWEDEGRDFTDLLYALNQLPGLVRIRFMTSHPKDISPKLIKAYSELDKLCKHIHLPVQSGSDKILSLMNRGYGRETYLSLIDQLRTQCPEIAISTDIIIGFPGETEEDFLFTLHLAREASFDSAFTFLYSIRKGTPAENFQNQVEESVKHHRFNRLVEELDSSSKEKNRRYIGKTLPVLVESISKTDEKILSGRTDTFKLVHFPGRPYMVGDIVNIEIIDAKTFSLEGVLAQK